MDPSHFIASCLFGFLTGFGIIGLPIDLLSPYSLIRYRSWRGDKRIPLRLDWLIYLTLYLSAWGAATAWFISGRG